jgi:hypothetical protein
LLMRLRLSGASVSGDVGAWCHRVDRDGVDLSDGAPIR